MQPTFHLDTSKFSLTDLRKSFESRTLLPSRAILKNKLTQHFKTLKSEGINSLKELLSALKNKSAIEHVSEKTGISVEYLTILKREAGSYLPNPVTINKFPGIDPKVLQKLEYLGIKNSKQLFERTVTKEDKKQLAKDTGLSPGQFEPVIALCDLSRLYGVGPVFARLLLDIGIDSVKKFLSCTHKQIKEMYEKATGKKADFTENDIRFTLEIAKYLQ